jgi:hypothetical protein
LNAQADALTNEPEERLLKKLSSALCAALMFPELSAEPIFESRLVNEVSLELLDEVLLELLDEDNRLVTAS